MQVAVLTFPGHFFQTQLCLRSIHKQYPESTNHITVIADDVQSAPWHDYIDDLKNCLRDAKITVIPVSSFSKIKTCIAGWWRQQLIKLTMDVILPGEQWFVVDGDVIFLSRCNVRDCVPISRRYDARNRWNYMCQRYVKDVLGVDQGMLQDQDQPVVTSAVPFRHLDRDLLQALRSHVECRWHGDFVDLHLAWFQDQTIVADIDPPTRWVMSEWELIECFRRTVQGHKLPYHDLGSGYQLDACVTDVVNDREMFLHGYKRDAEIGRQWFQDQALEIDDRIWQRSQDWYHDREVLRLV